MGITVLGDIISILKHAKQVQSRLTTDRALKQSKKQERNKPDSNDSEQDTVSSQESAPSVANSSSSIRERRTIKTILPTSPLRAEASSAKHTGTTSTQLSGTSRYIFSIPIPYQIKWIDEYLSTLIHSETT